MVNDLAQALARDKNSLIFELFKKHGYSRKKVMSEFTQGTVKLIAQGNRETYYIDNKEIFTIEKLVHLNNETCSVIFTYSEVAE